MKYFIDADGVIFAYEEDGSQDNLIGDKTEISEDDVNAILNPAPSKEQIIATNEAKKSQLRSAADKEIVWRQDAVDAGIATGEESVALAEWIKYRVLLMRVDTAAPVWPTPPAVQAR
ncbi:tail fiber assembly protein [Escherichia coli]|uniref:tail fiber assembly protein n=1 Tax=Escherichia coli TaxID=562 RepID=UPI003013D43C